MVSYDANDLRQFEITLTDKRNNIQSDPFLMEYVDPTASSDAGTSTFVVGQTLSKGQVGLPRR